MPVKAIPEDYPACIPYLMVDGAERFIGFMQSVLDAKLVKQIRQPDGRISHAELRVRDSMIMLSEAAAEWPATPVMLHFYVEDVDAVFKSAIAAGARVVAEPSDPLQGDRSGGCKEPSGNTIWLATRIADVSPDEPQKRSAAMQAT